MKVNAFRLYRSHHLTDLNMGLKREQLLFIYLYTTVLCVLGESMTPHPSFIIKTHEWKALFT